MSSPATPSLIRRRTVASNPQNTGGIDGLSENGSAKHGGHQGHNEEQHTLFDAHEHEHEHGTDAEKVIEALKGGGELKGFFHDNTAPS